ncbi:MAG: hypothetical protein IJT18_04310 [Oscillospiraceae bacterium]|nr:hypothetical protein [Oscillospiraceae bacterium]
MSALQRSVPRAVRQHADRHGGAGLQSGCGKARTGGRREIPAAVRHARGAQPRAGNQGGSGQRTRAAYSAGDKKALAAVAEDYGALLPRLEKLYAAVRAQWMAENKQQGFEVQDLRLGGVIRRVESCRQTLLDYLAGRLERIDPLEEPTLDLTCGTGKEHTPVGSYWKWQRMVTAGYTEMAPGYNER